MHVLNSIWFRNLHAQNSFFTSQLTNPRLYFNFWNYKTTTHGLIYQRWTTLKKNKVVLYFILIEGGPDYKARAVVHYNISSPHSKIQLMSFKYIYIYTHH